MKTRCRWQPEKEWLEQKYVFEGKILSEIGKECGVSALTVMRALIATGIARRGPKNKMTKRGSANGNWGGERAKYSALHKRLYKILGKAERCEECGRNDSKTVYNWANLTGKLDDPNDYTAMCRRCHMLHDNKKQKELKGFGFLWEKPQPLKEPICQQK